MQPTWEETLRNAIVTGSVVGAATTAAAALRGKADTGSAIAPINATSHVIHGPNAGDVDVPDLAHTLVGFAINAGASVFWATLYERLITRENDRADASAHLGRTLLGAGAVAALAYVVDYHLVPKRLTPGWEHRVSGRSLAMIFGAMALALPVRNLLARRP